MIETIINKNKPIPYNADICWELTASPISSPITPAKVEIELNKNASDHVQNLGLEYYYQQS